MCTGRHTYICMRIYTGTGWELRNSQKEVVFRCIFLVVHLDTGKRQKHFDLWLIVAKFAVVSLNDVVYLNILLFYVIYLFPVCFCFCHCWFCLFYSLICGYMCIHTDINTIKQESNMNWSNGPIWGPWHENVSILFYCRPYKRGLNRRTQCWVHKQ